QATRSAGFLCAVRADPLSLSEVSMRALVLSALLVTLAAGSIASQRLPAPLFPSARTHVLPGGAIPARVVSEPSVGSPLLAAAGLGVAGLGRGRSCGTCDPG